MRAWLGVVLAVPLALGLVVLVSTREPAPSAAPVAGGGALVEALPTSDARPAGEGPIYMAEELQLGIAWQPGARTFHVRRSERNPNDDGWHEEVRGYSVAYPLDAVASRPNGEVLAAGRSGANTIITRVRFPDCAGALATSLPTYPHAPGASVEPVDSLDVDVVGGRFVAPRDRSCPPFEAVEIYRGATIGTVLGMRADPEGRFVIAACDDGQVHRIGSTELATPTVVLDGTETPHAGELTGHVEVWWHATEGRKYLLSTTSAFIVVLSDVDNDEVVDDVMEYERAHFTEPLHPFDAQLAHDYHLEF